MSDIQNPNGFEANETIDGVNDIMHIFQPGSAGTRRNKRIILNTLKAFFQIIVGGVENNIVTLDSSEEIQDSGVAVADVNLNSTHRGSNGIDHFNLLNSLKGMNHVVLTNYTSTGVPAIAVNSQCEINGAIYTNPSEVAITGSTFNSTWYDILLTPSGTTFVASFIARDTGVWSDSKQGLYSGNNRVVAAVYRDGSGNFINKNILIVENRTIEIKMEIGDWNMTAAGDDFVNVNPGLLNDHVIRFVAVIVRRDTGTVMRNIPTYGNIPSEFDADITSINQTTIQLTRRVGGAFDGINYDSTSYNRGWITFRYEV